MRNIKGSGHQSAEDLRMQYRKKKFLPTRSIMQLRRDMGLNLESNKIEVMVGDFCNDGFVVMIITRIISRCIRVENLRSIVLKRCRQLRMSAITFLIFIQLWKTNKKITKHPSLKLEGRLYDKVVYILIEFGSNYSYVNPDFMDNHGSRKKVDAESWLV